MFHGSAICTTSRQVDNAQGTLVKWRASGIEGIETATTSHAYYYLGSWNEEERVEYWIESATNA
jgi:hypothetical protein